jgi:ADP-heptose:LPS heptosyltransferase
MKINAIKVIDYYLGSSLIALLKPFVILLEKILQRDHSLKLKNRVTFIKLLGGGSLVIAFPALLGLRKKYPDLRMNIVTTKGITPFARSLNIFDSYFEIDYSSLFKLLLTSLNTYIRTFRSDTIIDLEVHSKLTTVFSVLSVARNRIGFYEHEAFWRRRIYTHMIYFNNFSGSYEFYDKIVRLFSISPSSTDKCREHLLKYMPKDEKPVSRSGVPGKYRICIGHACSDLGRERMLKTKQWEEVFRSRIDRDIETEVIFLGAKRDSALASEIIEALSPGFKNINFINSCGEYSLDESLKILSSANEFWSIDSSLLHYARLFKIKTVSWWGPTDPKTRLRKIPGLEEETYYCKIPCSPCTHVTEAPPCMGDNICIENLFNDKKREWTGLVT